MVQNKSFQNLRLILALITLSLNLLTINTSAASQAKTDNNAKVCLSKVQTPVAGKLSQKIREHFHAFERGDGIYATQEGQLSAIQSVIVETKYAWVLECPQRVRARGYKFTHNFTNQGGWSFTSKRSTRSTQINMGLSKRFWPATATYLHEMLHACQFADDRRTDVREKPRTENSKKLNVRLRLIGEVEAFKAMHDLFIEAVSVSPLACKFRNNNDNLVWRKNSETQERMDNGTFASGIIGWYVQNRPNYSYADFVNISKFEEDAVQYAFLEEWVGWREFRPLNENMASEVFALGLKYDSTQIPFLPSPFKYNLPTHFQRVLMLAKCYDGPLNDQWSKRSNKALQKFISLANLPTKTNSLSMKLLLKVWNAAKGNGVKCNK